MNYELLMKKLIIYVFTVCMLIQSCGFYGRQHGPTEWHRLSKPDFTIPPQAQYLKGLKFCLDPGHGGDAQIPKYKRGPTGVREAEMNLRVAFFLKEFLEKSGAIVILTRYGDDDVDLKTRAEIATLNQVDIFISLHHNATNNSKTNYTSTWYHGDADFSPASLDLARYIQQSLVESLRLPNQLPTGLLSDFLMYPDGFGVLRHLEVPGILLESSFYSDPREEKLLDNPAYNRMEAYAIYLGIVRWAAAGIPKIVLMEPHPDTTISDKQPTIYLKIKDGLHDRKGNWMLPREQYFSRQVTFFLDDSIAPFVLDRDQNLLIHLPEKPLTNGWHTVDAEVVNYFGNHNLPHPRRFRVAPPAQYLLVNIWNDRLPADGKAFTGIDVVAVDSDSSIVADGDTVKASTNNGRLVQSSATTNRGAAAFYFQAGNRPGMATINLSSGQAKADRQIKLLSKDVTLAAGFVRNQPNDRPLENVSVTVLPDSIEQLTNPDGIYYFPQISPGKHTLSFQKNGYFNQNLTLTVQDGQSNIDTVKLHPVFAGVLHDFVLVIDPRFGGKETGVNISNKLNSAQVNLQLAQLLKNLFEQAGAKVYLTRDKDIALSKDQRVALCNQMPEGGYYLRLNLDNSGKSARLFKGGYYAGNEAGKKLLQTIADRLTVAEFTDKVQIAASDEPEIRLTNRAAIAIDLHLNPGDIRLISNPDDLRKIALAIFMGFVEQNGKETLPAEKISIKIVDHGAPISGANISLNPVFNQTTDQNGIATFEFLEPGQYLISISIPESGIINRSVGIPETDQVLIDIFR